MINIVLVSPQIPPNTGNVIRLCANTGAALHLVKPMGFTIDHSRMRRAGLDYHEFASMTVHEDWLAFKSHTGGAGRMFAITTRGQRSAFDQSFEPADWLVFGSETSGLPESVFNDIGEPNWLRIPMQKDSRSLNLSNAVAVMAFEAWRQQDFSNSC